MEIAQSLVKNIQKYTKDLVTEFVSYGVNCLELDGLFIWVK